MSIKGIHHVCIKCTSPEKYREERHFYCDLLGLPVRREWDTGMLIDTGAGYLEIFNNETRELSQGMIQHFALATDDPDALIAAVRAEGYPVTVEPQDTVVKSDPPYPIRIAFCLGPVGEEIEFFKELQG